MEYATLKRVYYANRDQYESEYSARYNSITAVHIDFDMKGYPAFFLPTPEIMKYDYNIGRMDRTVSRIRAELPSAAARQYYVKSLIDEVHLTLDIEQVVSTRKQIAAIHRGKQDKRLSGMINKYATLTSGAHIPLDTCEDIRALYDEICLPEVISENDANKPDGKIFRKHQTQVIGKSETLLHEGLYPEERIIDAMCKALAFLNNTTLSLPIRVAVFHYMMGYIHPFYDGNGRLARFISSYSLSREMDPLIGVRLSYTIKENKSSYYRMFKETNNPINRGDLTYFIIGFLKILDISYNNLLTALQEKAEQLKTYAHILFNLNLEKRLKDVAYLLLQVTLFSPNGMRFNEIQENAGIPQRPLRQFLTSDATKGMFKRTKDGRAYAYALNLDWLRKQTKSSDSSNPS
jgi:Fic family protein